MPLVIYSLPIYTNDTKIQPMADFLTVVSVVAFIGLFSGLIWALDRV
jgi:hypothetical protein